MKKSLFTALGAFALLFGACSSEAPEIPEGNEGMVSVTLAAPEALTRAGDAAEVNELCYAVYDLSDGGKALVEDGQLSENVTFPYKLDLKLITGRQYGLLFYAGNQNAPYTWSASEGTLSVDYSKTVANDETLDAFYAYETVTVDGNASLSVTMQRPFAMLNIGASTQPAADGVSSVTVKGAATSINLTTGTVSGTETARFAASSIPQDEEYPVEGFYYVAFAYILAPLEATPGYSVSYTYAESATSAALTTDVTDVTLQANYRTNIYGSLPQ